MAKKDKKPKLPKKVGGVKLPKDLRKTAKTAIELAQNPLAREVVSAALVAGAAALAKRSAAKPAPRGESKAGEIGSLLAQGVMALMSGLGKSEQKPEDKPAATAESRSDGAKQPPRPRRG